MKRILILATLVTIAGLAGIVRSHSRVHATIAELPGVFHDNSSGEAREEIRKDYVLSPGANVIPVWTTECEELDKETFCAGVGCFKGTCWREFTAQLAPLAQASPTIAALLPYKSFQRDLDSYGPPSGWIAEGLGLFAKMPLRYGTNGVPADRLIAVLQGWDVTPQEIQNQLGQAEKTGAAGEVVSYIPIEQSWSPRVFDFKQLVR